MPPSSRNPLKSPSFVGLRSSSEAASRAKRANRKHDTKPELVLRRALWALGLRYRKHSMSLPGNPDVVFVTARVAVFCDGDFWHGRNWPELRSKLLRRHNAEYWVAKITRNRERDREQTATLTSSGWLVLRLWETDVMCDTAAVAQLVWQHVQSRLTENPS
jgi:DNA mismatch endonuclease (patch repair protein)